jgi:hypothetical protein
MHKIIVRAVREDVAKHIALFVAKDLNEQEVESVSKEGKRTYADICKDMKAQSKWSRTDPEDAHITADKLLVEALELFGMKRLVKAYNKVDKWYA